MADQSTESQPIPTDEAVVPPRKRSWGFYWFAGIAAVAMVAIAVAISTLSGPALNVAPDIDFTLYQGQDELGGTELSLSDLRGRPVVLNFWAGLCPPCIAEMPEIQLFYDEYKDRVTMLGLDLGRQTGLGSQADAVNLLSRKAITYPAGFSENPTLVQDYRVLGMPTTIFIGSDGSIFREWGGLLTLSVLREVTDNMLAAEAG